MLTEPQRRFLDVSRVGHLATADANGAPHVIPVCYAIEAASLYITIDQKPKRATQTPLKRIANILVNPAVAVCVDRYDDTWTRLAWILLRGAAEILAEGIEHHQAQNLLRQRYPQYQTMAIDKLPVIALRIAQITTWGDLSDPPD